MKHTEHDRAELEKFKRYIRACVKWDNEHNPRSETSWSRVQFAKRSNAHAKIYHDIYGHEKRTGSCHVPE